MGITVQIMAGTRALGSFVVASSLLLLYTAPVNGDVPGGYCLCRTCQDYLGDLENTVKKLTSRVKQLEEGSLNPVPTLSSFTHPDDLNTVDRMMTTKQVTRSGGMSTKEVVINPVEISTNEMINPPEMSTEEVINPTEMSTKKEIETAEMSTKRSMISTEMRPTPTARECVVPACSRKVDDSDTGEIINDMLELHNYYRCLHGVESLSLDSSLVSSAEYVVEEFASGRSYGHFLYQFGENLYYHWTSSPNLAPLACAAVKNWYDEVKDYDFYNPVYSDTTGHFTQVVWKSTTKLGCGVARVQDGSASITTYVACEYDEERGNVEGQFAANVLEATSPSEF